MSLEIRVKIIQKILCSIYWLLWVLANNLVLNNPMHLKSKNNHCRFPVNYEGAPQRRLYMPEWYVTMVKPDEKNLPKNYVKFHIPAELVKIGLLLISSILSSFW